MLDLNLKRGNIMKVVEFRSNFSFNALDEQIKYIGKCKEQNRVQYIIVPDRFSLSMEKLLMEKLNFVSCFDVHILSFSKLANLVLKNDKTKKILNVLDATIITQYILKKHKDELKCFTKIPASTGFAQVLFDSISQLKSCQITPGMIRYSASKQLNENLKLKLFDIALVYELYENFLKDEFVDSNNKLKLLCEKMKISGIFENADVHFCNFLDLTNQNFDVLKEAIKCSNSLSITTIAPTNKQNNKDIYVSNLSERVKEICEQIDVNHEIIDCENLLDGQQNHILNNLFALEKDDKIFDKIDVELYSYNNKDEEVLFLSKRILNLLDCGVKLDDVCVICSDLNDYKNVIEQVFIKYNLPFWIDQNMVLDETEYFKLLKNIFDAINYAYQTDDVIKITQNILFALTQEQKERIFVYANKFGFVGNVWKEELSLNGVDENFLKFLEDKKCLIPVFEFEQNIKKSKTINDFCESLKILIEKLNLGNLSNDLSVYFENKSELKQSSIFRQVHQKVEKILEQFCYVLGEEECSFSEWIEMFFVAAKTTEISPIPMGINSVLVGQMLLTIFEPKKYYFVLGATSQKLPAFVKDVGIISDDDILALRDLNITPTIEEINKKTVFTILQNLCLWEEKLIVSMPQNDFENQNEPSSVLKDLRLMFKTKHENLPIIEFEKMLDDKNVFKNNEQKFNFLLRTKQDVLDFVAKNKKNIKTSQKTYLKSKLKSVVFDYVLSEFNLPTFVSNAKKLYFVDGFTKATQIERYFSCPFLHFVEHGLKLKENEESKVTSLDVGNILHKVCERFAKFSNGKILEDVKIEHYAKLFFDEIIKQKEFEHLMVGPQNRALMSGLKVEAVRVCKALNYQNKHSKYKTVFVEKSFGESDFVPIPEICVYNTKNVLKLKGKVDRVDFYDKKFRVVDYKTGKLRSDFKMLDYYMGKKMQLFIYLYAIYSGLKEKIPTGAYYFPVTNDYLDSKPNFPYQNYCMNGVTLYDVDNLLAQDDLLNFENPKSGIVSFALDTKKETKQKGVLKMKEVSNAVSGQEFYAMINYSYKLVSKALAEILEGFICPKPTKDACDFCNVKSFCPYFVTKNEPREDNFEISKEGFFEEVLKND